MTAQFAAIGLVVADMGRALAFYRALGLDAPMDADDQPHVDVPLPNGARLMFDTIDTGTSGRVATAEVSHGDCPPSPDEGARIDADRCAPVLFLECGSGAWFGARQRRGDR